MLWAGSFVVQEFIHPGHVYHEPEPSQATLGSGFCPGSPRVSPGANAELWEGVRRRAGGVEAQRGRGDTGLV